MHTGARIQQELRYSVNEFSFPFFILTLCGFFHYQEEMGAANPRLSPSGLAQLAGKIDFQCPTLISVKSQELN